MSERQPVRGGMRITEPMTVSGPEERDVTRKWLGTVDEAKRFVRTKGFINPKQPGEQPVEISADMLIGSTPEQYAEIFVTYLRWYNYTTPIKAEIESTLLGISNGMEDLVLEIRSTLRTANEDSLVKLSDKELKERIEEDVRIRALKLEQQRQKQMLELIDSQLKVISKNMSVVSRLQEERKVEFTGERRDSNIRRPQPQGEQHTRFRGK